MFPASPDGTDCAMSISNEQGSHRRDIWRLGGLTQVWIQEMSL